MLKHLGFAALLALCPIEAAAFEVSISSSVLGDEVRDLSLAVPLAADGAQASPQDVVAAAQADYARIVGLMYDRGYFAPVVSIRVNGREASAISPVSPPGRISSVEIRVEAGAPFRFGTARLAPLAPGSELPAGFASGQPASTGTLQAAVEAGVASWREQGHAKAALASQRITARHGARRLDADIRLAPGPRLRFGALRVKGNEAMRTERIRDIAGLPTGQVFSPHELDRAATRLRRTGVFSVVALSEAEQISQGDTLDIGAQVIEAKPRRFGFGGELSSHEGLGVSAFWLHRNLLGGGERLRIGGEVGGLGGETGGEDYELTLSFGRPATFNEDTDFFATAEVARLNEPSFSTDRIVLEAGIRRYASERRQYTFGLGFEAAKSEDAFGRQSYRIVTVPLSAEFDERDAALNAKSGYYAKASVTPFLSLSGTENGVRTYLDLRAYRSVGAAQKFTFAVRGQVGSVVGPDLAATPADFRFYSGGGGSVRGQDYQSLGVDLGGGNVVGGRSFLGLSGELRVQTGAKLSLAGFLDAGYVGRESVPDGSSGQWHTGAGVGLRYDTGIGPVRLDIGVPLSGPGDASGFEIYVGIGQAF